MPQLLVPPVPKFAVPNTGTGGLVVSGRVLLKGFGLHETSGTVPATVMIYDASSASGSPVVPVTFAAGESVREWFDGGGIVFDRGVFLAISGSTVDGHVYAWPLLADARSARIDWHSPQVEVWTSVV